MKNLDDVDYGDIDRYGMYESIHSYPEQIEEMLAFMKNFEIGEYENLKNVIFCGMGGSAITGDIVRSALSKRVTVPIIVNRDSKVPPWVNKGTLAVCVSYSGNTRETLSALMEAHTRGAHVVCISSGGKMEEISLKYGFPYIRVKGGMQPRAALGYMLTASLSILTKTGIVTENIMGEISETLKVLRDLRSNVARETPLEKNLAKKIATKILGKIPQVYASDFYLPVARRWVTQFNENSKIHAEYKEIPECNHNHVVAVEGDEEKTRIFVPIFLRDPDENKFLKGNIEYLQEIYRHQGQELIEVYPDGKNAVSRLLYAIYLGDFVSYYLAILRDVDPTPVDTIKKLKKHLERIQQ